jgi:hypothetical protein
MGKHPFLIITALFFLIGCKREAAENSPPSDLADFILQGNPYCSGSVPTGNYALGVNLDSSNTVAIQVNVTKQGSYDITAYNQGMTFRRAGYFANKGLNTVTLIGSGVPTTSGIILVPVTIGNTSCSFSVNVSALASYTTVCSSIATFGLYNVNTSLNSSNKILFSVNVITPGPVNITGGPVNGMTFSSGPLILSSTGLKQIVLNGSGIPLNMGNFTFTLPGSCTFSVEVNPFLIHWSLNEGSTFYSGLFFAGDYYPTSPISNYSNYLYRGLTANWASSIRLGINDIDGGIHDNEIYTTTSSLSNNIEFEMENGDGYIIYSASPSIPGLSFQVIVTNHNAQSHTIKGTFSGTVKDINGNTKTITDGAFTGTYP